MKRKILAASGAIAVFMAGAVVGVAGSDEPVQEPEVITVTETEVVVEEVEVLALPEACDGLLTYVHLATQAMEFTVEAIDETARILSGAGQSEREGREAGENLMRERDHLEGFAIDLTTIRERCEEAL